MGVSIFVKLSYTICHIYYSISLKKKHSTERDNFVYIYAKIIRENVFEPLSQDCTMNSVISDENSKY